jgi:acetyl-CoA carboxylase carboxyl transferase subunit alpha
MIVSPFLRGLGAVEFSLTYLLSGFGYHHAEALGITAHRLKALGLIDKIVNEPVGGAHRDPKQMSAQLKRGLNDAWRQVTDMKVKELLERRYERLQSYGRFSDTKADAR